jgi:hypothetical protein
MHQDICVEVMVECLPHWKIIMVNNTYNVKKHNTVFTSQHDSLPSLVAKINCHWKHFLAVAASLLGTKKGHDQ